MIINVQEVYCPPIGRGVVERHLEMANNNKKSTNLLLTFYQIAFRSGRRKITMPLSATLLRTLPGP